MIRCPILDSVFALGFLWIWYFNPVHGSCDVAEHRLCRRGLIAELDQQSGARLNNQQLEQSCRKLEGDLNCLALHVTRCPTPNRSGELLSRGQKQMQDNCEQFGGWWSYDCFHLDEVKKCEKIFALKDSTTDRPSCREYDRFRHCVSDVIRKRCSSEDEASLGNYLLDSAGELLWSCPHATTLSSPDAREGWVGVVPKEDDPFSKDPHGGPRGSSSSKDPILVETNLDLETSQPRKRSGGFDVGESHLRGVYSAAITGEGPYTSGCSARATEETRGCLDRHQYERDQALGARGEEDRLRKECCATWNYRRCLQNAVRIHCYDTREVDVQSAVDVIPNDRGFLCRNHWIYTCSGALRSLSTPATPILILLVVLVRLLTDNRLK